MGYADWNYYSGVYQGKAIGRADFDRLALRAGAYIDYVTCGRAAKHPQLEAVKLACCALAERYQVMEAAQTAAQAALSSAASAGGREMQSETVGPLSRSYRAGGDSASAAMKAAREAASEAELAGVARQYLAATGLLYRGRRCCL